MPTTLTVCLLGVTLLAQSGASPPLTLQAAFAAAEEHNLTLIAARLRRTVAAAGVAVAGQRPNPEFSFEAGRDTPHESLTVGLPLELGGKRARRVDLARAAVARADADVAVQSLTIRHAVRLAYFDLVAAADRVEVTTDLRALANRVRDAARDRFASGAAPRLELVQADLALAQAENEAEAATGHLAGARAALNALLGQPTDVPIVAADSFEAGDITEDVRALVASGRDVAAIDRQIDEAVARERLARAMRKPDPTLSGGVLFDARPEFTTGWTAGVALTIPVFTTGMRQVQVESATVAQLRAEREALLAELAGSAASAAARARAARRQYLRYKDEILPQLHSMEAMAEDSYRSGQTGLPAFLQALQSAREIRLRATEAGVEYQAALADFERAIGGPVH